MLDINTLDHYAAQEKLSTPKAVPKMVRYLLGELDVVENDEGTLDIEHCSVVDSRCNVVVGSDCLNVYL